MVSILSKTKHFHYLNEKDLLMLGLGINPFVDRTEQRKYFIDCIFSYQIVFTAGPGTAVAHKALETANPRAATCFASDNTVYLSLSSGNFKRFFDNINDADVTKKVFLEEYFTKLTKQKMHNFAFFFEPKMYERGNFLFRQNDPVSELFFIESGHVELFKKPSGPEETLSDHFKKKAEMNLEDKLEALRFKPKKRTELDLLKIGIIAPMSCLGDYDFLMKPRKNMFRTFSAKVVSSTLRLYELKERNFKTAMEQLGPYVQGFFKKSRTKRRWINERLTVSTDPATMIQKFYENVKKKDRLKKKKKSSNKLRKVRLTINPIKPQECPQK